MSLKTGGVATAQLKAPPTAQQSPELPNPPLRATVSAGAVPPYAAPRAKLISPEPEEPRTPGNPPPFPSVAPAVHPPPPQARESQISIIELDDIDADSIPPLPLPSPEMVAVPIPVASQPPVPSDNAELSELTQVSPARARAMRRIVGTALAVCFAIMVLAGWRILQRRDKNAGAPELTAAVVATSPPPPSAIASNAPPAVSEVPSAPSPQTEDSNAAAQAAVPIATPASLTKTRTSGAPAVRRLPSPPRPIKNQGSTRKPARTVRPAH